MARADTQNIGRVLVTGASGFIGGHVVRAIHAAGIPVAATSRRAGAWPAGVADASGVDLTCAASVDALLSDLRPDTVVHCASPASTVSAIPSAAEALAHATNFQSFLNNAQTARVRRFIFLGSAQVYASSDKPLAEDQAEAPDTAYGLMKCLESRLGQFACTDVFKVTELRLFNVYGPSDAATRLVPGCIAAVADGRDITLRSGANRIDLVHVDDVCRAALAALSETVPAGVVNVCTGQGTTVSDVAKLVVELAGGGIQVIEDTDRSPQPARHRVGDPARLTGFGCAAQVPLRQGLRDLIETTLHQTAGMS